MSKHKDLDRHAIDLGLENMEQNAVNFLDYSFAIRSTPDGNRVQ